MQYTPDEISKIHLLTEHPDLNNVLLAFELIKARGITPELLDDIYWIYNRLTWVREHQVAKQVVTFFLSYWGQFSSRTKVHQENLLYLDPLMEKKVLALKLNLGLLSKRLYHNFSSYREEHITRFIFKYGTEDLQKKILPSIKRRDHAGRLLLDLGGLGLNRLPRAILEYKQVQILKIWGNNLEELPDFWEQFQFLEVLNLEENKLQTLPPSFTSLQKLQRLYAQSNCFEVPTLLQQIKQLGKISHLAITSSQEEREKQYYTTAEQESLEQIEALVNFGKIHRSEKEQNLFLALVMNKKAALQELSLMDLFAALSDGNEYIQKQAKTKILNWKGAVFSGKIPSNASIAILGFVSFATRNLITRLSLQGIQFTTELTSKTTHIVLGDLPETSEILQNNRFIFMTEEDLNQGFNLRY